MTTINTETHCQLSTSDVKSGYFQGTVEIFYVKRNKKGEQISRRTVRCARGTDKTFNNKYLNETKEWRKKQLNDYGNILLVDESGVAKTMKLSGLWFPKDLEWM